MGQFSWKEAARTSWDKRAASWHEQSVNMWENGSRKEVIPFVQQHIPKGYMADLGCGDGYGSYLLSQKGYKVAGMDLSEKMIKLAKEKERPGLSYLIGDLNNPPFRENELDGVMAINSLEWTEQPLHALNKIQLILKPGGYACFGILGPTAMPRRNSYPRLLGEKVICNTMMPWEFEKLAMDHHWIKVAEKGVYKRGVKETLLDGLSGDLKQALTFMSLFIFKNNKIHTGENDGR